MSDPRKLPETFDGMRPRAWRADGTPVAFEIVTQDEGAPRAMDNATPIQSPIPVDRLPRVQRVIAGSPIDEARGFNIRVSTLAAVLGGGAVLLALVFGASLSLWTAAMWFGTAFALTWAGAFVLDAMTSPGGVELFHAAKMWRFLDNEQRYRHGRRSRPMDQPTKMLIGLIVAVLAGLGLVAFVTAIAFVSLERMPK